jgi:hypothetical protein
MSKLKIFAIVFTAVIGLTSAANATTTIFATDDFVGISFWIISMGMLAATAFFFLERGSVAINWRPSVTVAGLVTGIAFINYMYMRGVWVKTYQTGDTLTVYRYLDWIITMPLQMVEFYLILSAVRKVSLNIFWRILAGSLVMVVSGFLGELDYINSILGFVIAVAGWIYVLYEIYSGEAGKMVAKSGNKSLVTAYGAMRIIVTIGWAIYPLGYVFSYLTGSDSLDGNSLNVIYNLADFINKIAFGLIIYACAVFNTTSRIR